MYYSAFTGFLYVYFSQSFRFKIPILLGFATFIIAEALRNGMFTIIAYMAMTLFSIFFLGKRTAFGKKIVYFFIAAFILLLIQSVKPNFRQLTWKQGYEGNRATLLVDLVKDKLSKTSNLISPDVFFPIYYRTNQGFNVALVMRRIPHVQAHDNGSNLLQSLAASFVPRLLWQDKPTAGGAFNMRFYTGIIIKGWSTNVGPLGEAYGSFGIQGGIIFMMILGLFIRFAYSKFFSVSRKLPLILFWIPVLFYQVTYSAETDTLQILNSLMKASFFIWLAYKFIPGLFGIESKNYKKETITYKKTEAAPHFQL
jgi:hypothetical protein